MPATRTVTCDCGWTATLTRTASYHAEKMHQARNCAPADTAKARSVNSEAKARAAVVEAGYAPEATPEQWVRRWTERPELYDDLLRVLAGTSLAPIEDERAMVRRRAA